MKPKKLEDEVNKMNEEEFEDFVRKVGRGHKKVSAVVRDFTKHPVRKFAIQCC